MIKDMLFGDSYNPLIVKAYQGDTLIFERNTWDYELGQITYDNVKWNSTAGKFDNATYTGIKPFTQDNIDRDWEMVFMGSSSNAGKENKNTIGIISRMPKETETGYNTNWSIEIGIEENKFYYDNYPNGKNKYVEVPSNNKEIKIMKVKDPTTSSPSYKFKIFVDGVLMKSQDEDDYTWALDVAIWESAYGPGEIAIGGCRMGNSYIFQGTLEYFKFRWLS
jgi:hypothetical protein